ncbi:protein of unknown function [Anaerosphaera aminiphila DSM 21120]|uniref:DUF1836 domain-containing protein n=1 Tax=Anaerosphaera aminiphila DSM 21120 TaxID=1120995 RepID=A0A1M5PMF3_9FIRM|nr:DUF1836 domain-containing protein [Anaerosphaera aminiphila]SHH02934.1 protein of unknown function [Anaerosphaera aminiphila DSM 21120]
MEDKIKDLIQSWNLLRYEEMPSFELYSDQLISIAEEQMKPFSIIDSYQSVTSSMVNNYVKAKIMPKPVKKKYNKDQLTVLLVISMLKTVFSIGEISEGIELALENKSYAEAYDNFCDLMELSLKGLFLEDFSEKNSFKDPIAIACKCVASKLYVQYTLMNIRKYEDE